MEVKDLFDQFKTKRILVVGDVMIDAYLRGKVSRVSPEAPVPIVNLTKTEDRLGGAANVALNIAALGAIPILCAVIGADRGGNLFADLLDKNGMSTEALVKSPDRQTTIKTRVIGNNQHLLRIDEEDLVPISVEEELALIGRISEMLRNGLDAIILEDYNKGVLTPRVITETIALAKAHNVPVTVDPKKDNFFAYKGVTLFKPNLKELKEGVGIHFDLSRGTIDFERAVHELEKQLENKITFVTLSEHGVFIKEGETKNYIPAHIRNIADVSGAGDTVIAVATLCLTAGLPSKDIADIANLSGGLVCEVSGVAPIDPELLMEEIENLKDA